MRRIAACIVAVLVVAAAGNAAAQQTNRPAKEALVFQVPQGFKLAFQNHRPNQSIFEFVPEGQTVENWVEMVTFMIFPGGQIREPREFNEAMRQIWQRQCRALSSPPIEQHEHKGYTFSTFLMDCTDPDRSSIRKGVVIRDHEVLLTKTVRGRDALYVLQRAWHGAKSEEAPLDRRVQGLHDWMAAIASSEICDGRIPDQPCSLLDPKPPAN